MATLKYSKSQIGLHWWIALLFGANYLVSDGMGRYLHQRIDGLDNGDFVAAFHVYVGIAFIAFALIRLLVKQISGTPEPVRTDKPRVDQIAVYTHRVLYLLMFLVPGAGLLAWYGKLDLFGEVHVILMNTMLALIGLHIAGAVYHKLVLRDQVLSRMSFFDRR